MSLIATVFAESEHLAPLVMPPLAFAGIAAAIFVVLGFVVWSYRDVNNRHLPKLKSGSHDSDTSGH